MQNLRHWLGCALALSVATAIHALDTAGVAELVHESDTLRLEQSLMQGLRSTDPRTRTAAARVAAVRDSRGTLNALRAALDRETDMVAARELTRALVIVGGERDIERAVVSSARLGNRLNEDVALAAARLGPAATEHYFTTFKKFEINALAYFRRALWGQPELATPLASKLLDANDEYGMWALYRVTADERRDLIDGGVLARAITGEEKRISADALWYVLDRTAGQGSPVDPRVKSAVAALPVPRDDADQLVAAELVRRVAGLPPRESPAMRAALAGSRLVMIHLVIGPSKTLTYLTDYERRLLKFAIENDDQSEQEIPFTLPAALPTGLAETVLRASGCNAGWLGHTSVTVDRLGRVQKADLTNVRTTDTCKRALNTLIRLSLAENTAISSPTENAVVPLVRSPKAAPCFDEPKPELAPKYLMGGFYIRPPRLRTYVEPLYPAGAARRSTDIDVEVVVSETGCVRTARAVGKTPGGAMNEEALLAASQWRFEPATINTTPIEFTRTVTVEFRP